MNQGYFDEQNWEDWYFGQISGEEVDVLLKDEDPGTFLLRDSSRSPDTYVICVKESTGVANYQIKKCAQDGKVVYKIREDWSFNDMPSLLSFYKRNLFKSTSLVKPVNNVTKRNHSSGTEASIRHSESLSVKSCSAGPRNMRMSAPADCRVRISREEGSPLYVKVVRNSIPSVYAKNKLTLKVGDIVRVTQRHGDQWEGELNGERGTFPFTCVEFTETPENQNSS